MADPKVVGDNNSTVPIRILRFKARYGYDLSDRLDETLRKYGRKYIKAGEGKGIFKGYEGNPG